MRAIRGHELQHPESLTVHLDSDVVQSDLLEVAVQSGAATAGDALWINHTSSYLMALWQRSK